IIIPSDSDVAASKEAARLAGEAASKAENEAARMKDALTALEGARDEAARKLTEANKPTTRTRTIYQEETGIVYPLRRAEARSLNRYFADRPIVFRPVLRHHVVTHHIQQVLVPYEIVEQVLPDRAGTDSLKADAAAKEKQVKDQEEAVTNAEAKAKALRDEATRAQEAAQKNADERIVGIAQAKQKDAQAKEKEAQAKEKDTAAAQGKRVQEMQGDKDAKALTLPKPTLKIRLQETYTKVVKTVSDFGSTRNLFLLAILAALGVLYAVSRRMRNQTAKADVSEDTINAEGKPQQELVAPLRNETQKTTENNLSTASSAVRTVAKVLFAVIIIASILDVLAASLYWGLAHGATVFVMRAILISVLFAGYTLINYLAANRQSQKVIAVQPVKTTSATDSNKPQASSAVDKSQESKRQAAPASVQNRVKVALFLGIRIFVALSVVGLYYLTQWLGGDTALFFTYGVFGLYGLVVILSFMAITMQAIALMVRSTLPGVVNRAGLFEMWLITLAFDAWVPFVAYLVFPQVIYYLYAGLVVAALAVIEGLMVFFAAIRNPYSALISDKNVAENIINPQASSSLNEPRFIPENVSIAAVMPLNEPYRMSITHRSASAASNRAQPRAPPVSKDTSFWPSIWKVILHLGLVIGATKLTLLVGTTFTLFHAFVPSLLVMVGIFFLWMDHAAWKYDRAAELLYVYNPSRLSKAQIIALQRFNVVRATADYVKKNGGFSDEGIIGFVSNVFKHPLTALGFTALGAAIAVTGTPSFVVANVIMGAVLGFLMPYLFNILWNFFWSYMVNDARLQQLAKDYLEGALSQEHSTTIAAIVKQVEREFKHARGFGKIQYALQSAIARATIAIPAVTGVLKFFLGRLQLVIFGSVIAGALEPFLGAYAAVSLLGWGQVAGYAQSWQLPFTVGGLFRIAVIVLGLKLVGRGAGLYRDQVQSALRGERAIPLNAEVIFRGLESGKLNPNDIALLFNRGLINFKGKPGLWGMIRSVLESKGLKVTPAGLINRLAAQTKTYLIPDVIAVILTLLSPVAGILYLFHAMAMSFGKDFLKRHALYNLWLARGKQFWVSFWHMWLIGAEIGAVIKSGDFFAGHPYLKYVGGKELGEIAHYLEGREGAISWGGYTLGLIDNALGFHMSQIVHDALGGTTNVSAWENAYHSYITFNIIKASWEFNRAIKDIQSQEIP
ncbi:MAG: hypothetical protein KKF80_05080, partial [Candidatus Omnitrophica bacterium]|nr:hypothetical protein [Candidatus Omnitrophota bacterium]